MRFRLRTLLTLDKITDPVQLATAMVVGFTLGTLIGPYLEYAVWGTVLGAVAHFTWRGVGLLRKRFP
jgi:hypothetical protein